MLTIKPLFCPHDRHFCSFTALKFKKKGVGHCRLQILIWFLIANIKLWDWITFGKRSSLVISLCEVLFAICLAYLFSFFDYNFYLLWFYCNMSIFELRCINIIHNLFYSFARLKTIIFKHLFLSICMSDFILLFY